MKKSIITLAILLSSMSAEAAICPTCITPQAAFPESWVNLRGYNLDNKNVHGTTARVLAADMSRSSLVNTWNDPTIINKVYRYHNYFNANLCGSRLLNGVRGNIVDNTGSYFPHANMSGIKFEYSNMQRTTIVDVSMANSSVGAGVSFAGSTWDWVNVTGFPFSLHSDGSFVVANLADADQPIIESAFRDVAGKRYFYKKLLGKVGGVFVLPTTTSTNTSSI